jgi:O-antigen ligase
LFRTSPLSGIGFGRFNDTHLEFAGLPNLATLAVDGERYYGSGIRWERAQQMTSTGNAHNSYLHTAAETGIIGLILLLFLWRLIYADCRYRGNKKSDGRFESAYCHGCRAMVVSLLATALPGHALAAPSGGILLATVIGAWLAYARFHDRLQPHVVEFVDS